MVRRVKMAENEIISESELSYFYNPTDETGNGEVMEAYEVGTWTLIMSSMNLLERIDRITKAYIASRDWRVGDMNPNDLEEALEINVKITVNLYLMISDSACPFSRPDFVMPTWTRASSPDAEQTPMKASNLEPHVYVAIQKYRKERISKYRMLTILEYGNHKTQDWRKGGKKDTIQDDETITKIINVLRRTEYDVLDSLDEGHFVRRFCEGWNAVEAQSCKDLRDFNL
ncbi:hypothetical protein PPACK8108_LOCUS9201 [Phakopsora pachyrhizi]|uniref:Uncharacterized protein n=1 Tax=Phakopsora pachyrhizi TaxID=170000 RepID=A0AAV0AXP0_PHAPC|nr:hypothetical protein PPACK8108_LOCUS9201 [Phakopsora pachyrhizi]